MVLLAEIYILKRERERKRESARARKIFFGDDESSKIQNKIVPPKSREESFKQEANNAIK